MKRVSIIIPAYNAASFIGDSVRSALTQTYPNKEIVVVDDGSTDDTRAILEEYIKSGQIKYFYQENKGPAAARNLGIKNSSGEFIAFLDADDVWLPEKLKKQIDLFKNPKVGLVYSDMEFFGDKFPFKKYSEMTKGFYRGEAMRELIKRNFIPISSVVLRREVFEMAGYFNEDFKRFPIGEDYELWLRVARVFEVDFIPEAFVRYRIHAGQMSHGRIKNYRTLTSIYKKFLRDPSFSQYRSILYVRYLENKLKLIISTIFGL